MYIIVICIHVNLFLRFAFVVCWYEDTLCQPLRSSTSTVPSQYTKETAMGESGGMITSRSNPPTNSCIFKLVSWRESQIFFFRNQFDTHSRNQCLPPYISVGIRNCSSSNIDISNDIDFAASNTWNEHKLK